MKSKNHEFRDALADFRSSVREAGIEIENPGLQAILERGRTSRTVLQLRWGLAAALLVTLVILPIYQHQREAERIRQEHLRQELEDALLLQQINDSLSQQVPRAMAVLLNGN